MPVHTEKPAAADFDAVAFDTWFLRIEFDADNVPRYTFFTPPDGETWQQIGESVYCMDGTSYGNTVPTGIPVPEFITMKDVCVYMYRGVNPLLTAEEQQRLYPAGFIDRFRFYQFTGDAKVLGIGVSLDNYLIAVDTETKFVFAYGTITEVKKSFGQLVPQEYTAVEAPYGYPHGSVSGRPFYEYDPIGYVAADGTVILYEEYCTQMAAGGAVNYAPSVHNISRPAARCEPDTPGCSPYLLYLVQQ